MENSDFLLTIAEIAVAFAGFASLVTALTERSDGEHPMVQATRFRGMVILSLTVVAFSLVPFVPLRLGASSAMSWRITSGLFLLATFGCMWRGAREMAAGRAAGVPNRPNAVLRSVVTFGGICVSAVLLGANALGLFPSEISPGVYIVALLLFLLSAGVLFVALLFSRLGRPAA